MGSHLHMLASIALGVAAALVVSARAAAGGVVTDLPENPAVRAGLLGNGMRYLVVRHEAPAGAPERIAVTLRVMTGTVHEQDDQRGSVRALEMAARRAVTDAAPARVLRGAGVIPETDLDTDAQFESMTFLLGVPAGDAAGPAAVRAALESLACVFTPGPIDGPGLEALLAMALERERAAASPGTRANRALLPRILEGTRFAERVPWGDGAVAAGLSPERVEAFRARWVTPANSIVVAAGSSRAVSEIELESLVRSVFGRLASGPRPEPPDLGDVESRQRRAMVMSDPGLSGDFVQLSRTVAVPAGNGIASVARFVDELVSRVAFEALGARLERTQGAGDCAPAGFTRSISVRNSPTLGLCAVVTGGPAGSAPELARCLAGVVRGVLEGGLSDDEVADARRAVLGAVEAEARAEPNLPAEKIALNYADMLTLRDVALSASQRAGLTREMIDRVSPALVNQRLRARLDLASATMVALRAEPELSPAAAKASPPLSEAVLLHALDTPGWSPAPPSADAEEAVGIPAAVGATGADGSKSATRGVTPPRRAAPLSLEPARAGGPGRVARLDLHPGTGVLTGTLSNGVVVRHRAMGTDTVVVQVALQRGPMDEPAPRRVLFSAAAAAIQEIALPELEGPALRREASASGITWQSLLAPDAVTLSINASQSSAEAALALVRRTLLEGELERGTFERFRSRMAFMVGRVERVPEEALFDLHSRASHPGDDRPRAPSGADLEGLTFEEARAFTAELLRSAPIEVAIVGDIGRSEALELAERALADLPERAITSAQDRAARRTLPLPDGPASRSESIPTADDRSAVLEGFAPPRASEPSARLAREALAEVLAARLTRTLRDERRLTSAVRIEARWGEGWDAPGAFWAAAACAVGREAETAAAIREGFSVFTREAVSDAELHTARQRVAARLADELADPAWWATRLTHDWPDEGTLDDAVEGPGRALRLTPQDVLSAAQAVMREDRRISLVVTPRQAR